MGNRKNNHYIPKFYLKTFLTIKMVNVLACTIIKATFFSKNPYKKLSK